MIDFPTREREQGKGVVLDFVVMYNSTIPLGVAGQYYKMKVL